MAKAWSKSNLSLGRIEDIRPWRYVSDLDLTVEIGSRTEVAVHLDRISSFITAFSSGRQLSRLSITLQLDEDATPAYLDDVVALLARCKVDGKVDGKVVVSFDSDDEEDDGGGMCERLVKAIQEYVSTSSTYA